MVYPDDLSEPKPAVGEELNKRAIVSMHGFWPKDKQTHTPIKDKDRLQRMNYTKKLEGLVEKIGGTFVDYKPEKGTCEFEVSETPMRGWDLIGRGMKLLLLCYSVVVN